MARSTNNTRYSRYKTYAQGVIYHIYNRGNGQQNIFLEEADYNFYLNRLAKYLKKQNVSLICYVLMPNHVHLAVKQETSTPVFKLISSLHTSYSMYFNKKYKRVGHLFQDRFKQTIVESDEQLLYLTKYLHLNPVYAGFSKDPKGYLWSSYHEYIGPSPLPLCQREIIIGLIGEIDSQNSNFQKRYVEFCEADIPEDKQEFLEEIAMETS